MTATNRFLSHFPRSLDSMILLWGEGKMIVPRPRTACSRAECSSSLPVKRTVCRWDVSRKEYGSPSRQRSASAASRQTAGLNIYSEKEYQKLRQTERLLSPVLYPSLSFILTSLIVLSFVLISLIVRWSLTQPNSFVIRELILSLLVWNAVHGFVLLVRALSVENLIFLFFVQTPLDRGPFDIIMEIFRCRDTESP